jgi:hypothetical protein
MLGIEVDGYSHEFLEVYEKDGVKETVWTNWDCCLRSDEQILKDMENVWYGLLSFIFGRWKHTPAPLKRGVRSIRKKSWFNFQNYWYEDDSKFQLSKHKFPKKRNRNPLEGRNNK